MIVSQLFFARRNISKGVLSLKYGSVCLFNCFAQFRGKYPWNVIIVVFKIVRLVSGMS